MTAQTSCPPGWEEYIQRKEEHRQRIMAACGEYQDSHQDELRRLQADERRQAKREARRAYGELTEHEHQCLVVKWLEARGHRLWATCNGVVFGMGRDGAVRYAAYLKAEGKRRGVPDLVIMPPHGSRACTALEMKGIKGTVSPEQKEWLDYLESIGWRVIVAYGHEQAIERLTEAGY